MRYLAVLALLAMPAVAQTSPTVTLTPSVSSGISPLTVTLTWSSTGALSCTASGAWTGTKALSGSQTIANLTATTTYKLDCKAADQPGSATLSWTPPTQNTDDTALTNLAGYRISYGASASLLSQAIQVANPALTAYLVNNLPSGPQYFGIKAYTTTGVESVLSNVVTKTIAIVPGEVVSKSITVTVDTQPKPPVLTVAEVVAGVSQTPAYALTATGARGTAVVGFVQVGTACMGPQLLTYRGQGYRKVPRAAVKWWGLSPQDNVIAACA
jgi:hypothetical protein